MGKVKGARYNSLTDNWAIPAENVKEFEEKMGDYLIVWKGEEKEVGGIPEESIPDQPMVDGYRVVYGKNKEIISSEGFKTDPFGEFQVKGFNALVVRDFLILADDAGLGKTWMASTAMEARKKLGQVNHGVVVCKSSLIYNWRDEIGQHTHQKAVILAGTVKQRTKILADLRERDDWTFLIMSYGVYKRETYNLQILDNYKSLDFAIYDEAHVIKNPNSTVGTKAHALPFKYKYLLTATPLPNTPLESYNYLKLGHKVNINYYDFRHRYAVWGGRGKRDLLYYQNIKELREAIQSHMLRRLKEDKLPQLPNVIFKEVRIPMTPTQRKLYDAVRKNILEDLRGTELTKIPSLITKVLRLQQIVNSPALIGGPIESSKLNILDDILEEIVEDASEKVIVFSRFKSMIDILEDRYSEYNPAVIHGEINSSGKNPDQASKIVSKKYGEGWETNEEAMKEYNNLTTSDRQREVYKFQKDDSCKLFLGSSTACREGLTLTKASHVVFIDVEWSWAYVMQAYSRAHRIGQKDTVNVYFILTENSVDEHTLAVVRRKKSMSESMLTGGIDREQVDSRQMLAEMSGIDYEKEVLNRQ